MKEIVGISEYFRFVDSIEPLLDASLIADAREVEYGQWELPFEALLLALTSVPRNQVSLDFAAIEKLAEAADIIGGGVLDVDTWERFVAWAG